MQFKIRAYAGQEMIRLQYRDGRSRADALFGEFTAIPDATLVQLFEEKWTGHARSWVAIREADPRTVASPQASRPVSYAVVLTEKQRQLVSDALAILSPDTTDAQVELAMLIDAIGQLKEAGRRFPGAIHRLDEVPFVSR